MLLVVWDDWGGWYDHVPPFSATGYIGGNGNGKQYVYGFRVPLLVVSGWNKTGSDGKGYISTVNHDFGSILKFIEKNFNLLEKFPGINPIYPFADQFAGGTGDDDLSDFFQATWAQFGSPISLYNDATLCNQNTCLSSQNKCDASCFINYKGDPEDPDDE